MKIDWFEPTEDPIDPRQIDGAEAPLGIRFPVSYRSVLADHHNSYGDADFAVPGTAYGASIGHWLSLRPWDQESVWSSLSTWPENQLPQTVIPFGQDGGGNCICFDYRSGADPSVAVWYHELSGTDGLVTVAPTFDNFVGLLRAPAEA